MSRNTRLHVSEQQLLRDWARDLREMFDEMPYHVGSSAYDTEYRDVDVRVLLDRPQWDVLRSVVSIHRLNFVISMWGQQVTGLPIDFQVQETEAANEEFGDRRRNAVGMDQKVMERALGRARVPGRNDG